MSTGTPGSSSGIRLGGAPSTDSAPRRKAALMGRSPQDTAAGAWNYVLLILAIVGSAFPIYWMFIVSTGTDVYLAKIPPPVLPGSNFAHNIGVVLGRASEEGRSYNNAQFGGVTEHHIDVVHEVATREHRGRDCRQGHIRAGGDNEHPVDREGRTQDREDEQEVVPLPRRGVLRRTAHQGRLPARCGACVHARGCPSGGPTEADVAGAASGSGAHRLPPPRRLLSSALIAAMITMTKNRPHDIAAA